MEDIDSSPTSPNPRKRAAPDEDTPGKKPLNLKGTQFVMVTPPDTEGSSNASPNCSGEQQREGSPALSISTLSSIEVVSSNQLQSTSAPASTSKPPPAKRRKLTPSEQLEKQREKEAKEREKEAKEQEKAELKAKKEEEKRVKDEEKRKKAEEREAKKREKELEEQRKEEEKLKKQRSQMRLGAFFGTKPTTPAKSPAAMGGGFSAFTRRKSLSLEPFDAVSDQIRKSASPTKCAPQPVLASDQNALIPSAEPAISDYQKHFLPFELPTHSSLAQTFSIPNPDDLAYWQGAFDHELKDPSFQEKVDLGLIKPTAVMDHMFESEHEATRGINQPNLRSLMDQIQGTSLKPIDLTEEPSSQAPVHALQSVSRRYLHFPEEVRPPYFGTYTKIKSPRSTRRLMLNPFSRTRTDTDYDYDSEEEWEEPEEGEDILGDDEDEAESNDDPDEMDAFLDDEEDALKHKRKMITGDLQPTSTGLCWEDESATVVQSIDGEEFIGTPKEMQGMRLGVLLPGFTGQTIDPFSTAYWTNDMVPPAVPITDVPRSTSGLPALARPPLQERQSNGSPSQSLLGAAEGEKGPITSTAAAQTTKRGPKAQPKVLNTEDLEEFKEAVVGSPLGKIELCKGLKARFPKMTNETIKETLSSRFAHIGASKAEKKWVFVSAS